MNILSDSAIISSELQMIMSTMPILMARSIH